MIRTVRAWSVFLRFLCTFLVRCCSQIGDPGVTTDFCNSQACSLCSILRSSFEIVNFGQRTNFGRFGKGIYTSATASKSNDYIYENSSAYRAFILAKVVVGKGKTMHATDPTLTEAPNGYDSVIGKPGGDLNYDELSVNLANPSTLAQFESTESSTTMTRSAQAISSSPSPRTIGNSKAQAALYDSSSELPSRSSVSACNLLCKIKSHTRKILP
jgi:hypothetical protein